MRTRSFPLASGTTRTVAFDPFGEPLDAGRAETGRAEPPRDGRAHRTVAAAFWALALLLVAGRVYYAEIPVAQTVASLVQTAQAGFGILR